ncbi:MAG: hypothetical protein ACOC8K_05935 [Gemmatimonadota bacterium]
MTIPVGRYGFGSREVGYSFGPQRFFSGSLSAGHGEFYDGDLTSVSFSRGRVELLRQLSLEPSVSYNRVELPHGSFETTLAVARVNYAFTPRGVKSSWSTRRSGTRMSSTGSRGCRTGGSC